MVAAITQSIQGERRIKIRIKVNLISPLELRCVLSYFWTSLSLAFRLRINYALVSHTLLLVESRLWNLIFIIKWANQMHAYKHIHTYIHTSYGFHFSGEPWLIYLLKSSIIFNSCFVSSILSIKGFIMFFSFKSSGLFIYLFCLL